MKEMKVFLINDCEYWAATSLRKIVRYFASEIEDTIREFISENVLEIVDIDERYVCEVDEATQDFMRYGGTQEDRYWLEKSGAVVSFRRYIELCINVGHDPNGPIPIAESC
ncbi:hypothetical protein LEP1GSC126_0076 [Leptospira kirschneri str. 200801774]|uniref:hypothetical protein n=1 Tax=Leptospira kirschneri TaxID=29507 RepID=UPI0002C02FFC|nr:hypothetical protein [Leptospira kirschneri]EMO78586.1 hypothetical protein LEP1GSC126_0076 [Leptospira kirschneri str. 200801774]